MSFRIVTHCYARELPQYAVFLDYQLRAIDSVQGFPIVVSVCCTGNDRPTWEVLNNYVKLQCKSFILDIICLPERELWRRSIGRNKAALNNSEDFVWFTDVDYLPIAEFFRDVPELFGDASMIYPQQIYIHREHAIGDRLVMGGRIEWKKDFEIKTFNRAIGGVQIVRGELAREIGYLKNHEKWQTPVDEPFKNFRDDLVFRKECKARGEIRGVHFDPISLYRLRHTQVTYK